jgi:hypothetical protein
LESIPEIIEIAEHYYMSALLIEQFTNQMVFSWYVLRAPSGPSADSQIRASATNCARIYNETMHMSANLPTRMPSDWLWRTSLDEKDVWNGFYLNALLLDNLELRRIHAAFPPLTLRHTGVTHPERINQALHLRNRRMEGIGQEQWNHACDTCCWHYNQDGSTGEHANNLKSH